MRKNTSTRQPTTHIAPFGLRMQPELREKLEVEAAASGRSMNAELVSRLEQSLHPRKADSAGALLEMIKLHHEVQDERDALLGKLGIYAERLKKALVSLGDGSDATPPTPAEAAEWAEDCDHIMERVVERAGQRARLLLILEETTNELRANGVLPADEQLQLRRVEPAPVRRRS